ncbi:MAG: glutamate synthase subunit alpha, partial [Pseudomonadota bacterium]
MTTQLPPKGGLYDPDFEKDSCGVGFVCDIKGRASNQILRDAHLMNCAMEHRGGVGFEVNTGDGAGIMTGVPHQLYSELAQNHLNRALPEPGHYGAGVVFLPRAQDTQARCMAVVEEEIASANAELIGWWDVSIDLPQADLGNAAKGAMPAFKQLVVAANGQSGEQLERTLYLIRKHASQRIRRENILADNDLFYVCSLSSRIVVYKGMVTPFQLFKFYNDLQNDRYETHFAMVHSRFSTNTFPSWDRAQPNRFMSHNGEINTLLGNVNSTNSRQSLAGSELFGDQISKLFPVIEPDCSDSGSFDNMLEFLLMNGRTVQESVMMMIPEAWQNHNTMSAEKKAFYEYHSSFMEPWDGPA